MKRYYFLLPLMIFSYCLAEDKYYTYDKIVSTLEAWQDTFGLVEHPSIYYPEFGIIYKLITIGESSQDKLPIYAVKLSANVQERAPEPKDRTVLRRFPATGFVFPIDDKEQSILR